MIDMDIDQIIGGQSTVIASETAKID